MIFHLELRAGSASPLFSGELFSCATDKPARKLARRHVAHALMRAAPRLPRKSSRSSCGLQCNLVSSGLQFAHPPIFILRCAPQRMPTRLGDCAWTVASAKKRRKKSRRGTHERVRQTCADGSPHERCGGPKAHGDRTGGGTA